ncbi:MAG: hypothetical protein R2764_19755 [Bacteroidales bacterium]
MTLNSTYLGSFTHFLVIGCGGTVLFVMGIPRCPFPQKNLKSIIITLIILSVLILYYFMFYTPYWLANSLVICQMHTLGLGALIAYYMKYNKDFIGNLNLTVIKTITSVLILFLFYYLFIGSQIHCMKM